MIFRSHVQRSGQTTLLSPLCYSISFDPFTWSIPNLVQVLPSMRRWSLLILRSHVQKSRSNHPFEPSVISDQKLSVVYRCRWHWSWCCRWGWRCRLLCRKLFTFPSYSPEQLDQFQPNLAQSIFGWRWFKFVHMKHFSKGR